MTEEVEEEVTEEEEEETEVAPEVEVEEEETEVAPEAEVVPLPSELLLLSDQHLRKLFTIDDIPLNSNLYQRIL